MTKTRVVRSWSKTLGRLIGGLVCLAICVVMFKNLADGAITVGFSLIPGILGLVLIGVAIGGSATAPCPSCGKTIESLGTGSNDGTCCSACHAYVEGTHGELWVTDAARVADRPIFATKLNPQLAWPDGCCVCGQPATRGLPVSATRAKSGQNAAIAVATGGAVLATSSTKLTIEVPHCAQHDDGAQLNAGSNASEMRILFRSYPYLRSFCERNGTQPG
jgi:hypothetical protein